VADFRPEQSADQKIKKQDSNLIITLTQNDDILYLAGHQQVARVVIGFAAETQNLLENAQAKLQKKRADMIVANDVSQPGAGFAGDTNRVTFLLRDADPEALDLTTKTLVGEYIIQKAAALLVKKGLHDD
jgi:phosphopantothenoylcysteine decarboxylase/phosphopantothenate--cysteine ligase